MNKEDILNMDTIELKVEVAERILNAKVIGKEGNPEAYLLVGYTPTLNPLKGTWKDVCWQPSYERAWEDCPNYPEDISVAWDLIPIVPFWRIEFKYNLDWSVCLKFSSPKSKGDVNAKTAPLAICRAALLALEGEKG